MISPKASFLILVLSLCCCYDISTSFTTTTSCQSFINKHHIHHYHQHQHQHQQQQQNHHSKGAAVNVRLSIESKSRLFALPSDVDKNANQEPKIVSSSSSPSNDSTKSQQNIEIKGLTEQKEIQNNSQREEMEILNFSEDGLGAFDPSKKLPLKREVLVGDPQQKVKKEGKSVAEILTELAAIQKQGPQKYCILGSRHISYLHQQIIELLSYALVLSENHVYTSGAMGTNAAAIRGALRAGRPDLLTVIVPQSLNKQTDESQELLRGVTDLIAMPQNDEMSLEVASRLCNSKLLSETDQLVAFAFHESGTVIEATKEAKKLEMLVTTLFLD